MSNVLTPVTSHQVLLIDDSEADAILMRRALRKPGRFALLTWMSDATTGLKVLLNEEVDHNTVIFLDIKMPKLSGLDILATLQEADVLRKYRRLHVFSSSSLSVDVETALQYPNVVHYTKPEGFTELRNLLDAVLP